MIRFDGTIVQFGFGAVGKSFFEKISKEIKYNEHKYHVITMDGAEFKAYVNLGGISSNFHTKEVTRENYDEVFGSLLQSGDLLVDFADTVGTLDICRWCAERNIMYINTGETDWPDHWYCIFEENERKNALKAEFAARPDKNRHPIVLQHGNNPGLVSHFTKEGISYIVSKQFPKDKYLKKLVKEGNFAEAARALGLKMVHVNDIDLQKVKGEYCDNVLYTTWCMDSFWFEMLSEATMDVGTHESMNFAENVNNFGAEKGYFTFRQLAADKRCRTFYPGGGFEGYLVPHEETITIAKGLEIKENDKVVYRPTVMFLYQPCEYACKYFEHAKVNNYPDADPEKPQDCEDPGVQTIIRGYEYPQRFEVLYQEKIDSGTEYVGVLLLGDAFEPVWVGNRVETSFLYKKKEGSFWQTPTITPVSMSALAAVCWMLSNRNKGGIYFPDDISDYKTVLKTAEKYISKTIYRTFSKDEVAKYMQVNFDDLQAKDIFVE